ncbi:STAS-like domain-containing protein [Uliginosibacterium sp. 31-12]|uniref:STAS-like domain-containing protein n=1 Tax=Uliginosibacterium sp. 31-12 TaxID=3062781 RepID=UPI00270D7F00|nr:STAS-like domain-containing protein [Uliginosibacterium sp. 31-12]
MNSKKIVIASDFSKTPAGRYLTDGPASGQRFRDELLAPALISFDSVEVVLDGTTGYGSSFLEEAFGGLIRECHISPDDVRKKLKVEARTSPLYESRVWRYIDDAAKRR